MKRPVIYSGGKSNNRVRNKHKHRKRKLKRKDDSMKSLIRKEVLVQSRWRSKPLWIASFSLVSFVLKTYFDIEIPKYDILVEMVLLVATLLGIFNSSTDSQNF
jgi:hypothetical protein